MIQKAMKQVGRIFGVPIVIEGRTWFPLVYLIAWGVMSWLAGFRDAKSTPTQRLAVGATSFIATKKHRWSPAILLALFAGASLGVASGFIKEQAR